MRAPERYRLRMGLPFIRFMNRTETTTSEGTEQAV
jgi:hypothetical protein